jgi:pimeloyl-ACP methyl ester carboxylesterase
MTTTSVPTRTGYAPVNGLEMYYEVHGEGRPLVLLHGAFSAIPTSFGALIPGLASTRQVIGTELQAHGRTADIDRPLRVEDLADDVVGLLDHLEIAEADVFGYSLGAAVALQVALRHPGRVRKLVLTSIAISNDGFYPGFLDGMAGMAPEMLHGSPFHDEYVALAPDPDHFAAMFDKKQDMDRHLPELTDDQVRGITSPALIIAGDSDIFRLEHTVAIFRLFGGGVIGDMVGLPDSQLAVIPGATHVTVVHQVDHLLAAIPRFLDAETSST